MAVNTLNPDLCANKRFNVYLYRDPRPGKNNSPIYVGKGTASRNRAYAHWHKRSHNPLLARILSKIRAAGLSPIIEIVSWFDDETEAFALEITLIAKFGRRDLKSGSLANLTNGGEGTSGFIPSANHRAVTSARLKKIRAAQWEDPEFRAAALSNLVIGRSSPEARQRAAEGIRKAKAELTADPDRLAEQNAQRSELRRAAWKDPEIREHYLTAHKASQEIRRASLKAHYSNSPDAVIAKREWMNARLKDDGFRANLAAGVAKSKRDPEKKAMWAAAHAAALAKAGPANKLAWADPVKRAARLAAMKAAREKKRRI